MFILDTKVVSELLKIRTVSRSRQTHDNALVECKNGAMVRQVLGYPPIPTQLASALNRFHYCYLHYIDLTSSR